MKSYRFDIGLFRIVIILFLVVFHTFGPFANVWKDFGFDIPVYWWISKWSYSFFLEGFVFISGYLYGIQFLRKIAEGKNVDFRAEIKKKFHRLMLPSLLFSTLYIFMYNQTEGWLTPYRIMNGVGHLWFLPMLFSCFLCLFYILKKKIQIKWIVLFSIVISLITFPGLPLRFDVVAQYFIYFYLGFLLGEESEKYCARPTVITKPGGGQIIHLYIAVTSLSVRAIVLIVTLHVFIFIGATLVIRDYEMPAALFFFQRLTRLLFASCAVLVLFYICSHFNNMINESWAKIIYNSNQYCFGVYIYQQFILWFLYFYTSLPNTISPYILPWLFLVITIGGSVLLTFISLHTKYLKDLF